MTDAATPRTPADLDRLDAEAWSAQVRRPQEAAALGRALVAASAPGSPAAARGHFHVGWAELRWGTAENAAAALVALEGCLAGAAAGEAVAQAAGRELRAGLLRRERRFAEALALLEPLLADPDDPRLPHARCATATSAAIACGALHRMDDALRHFHRALAIAETSADDALVANAAGNVGAAHYDLFNLEDAERWCRLAHRRAGAAGAVGARVTAAVNLVLVLSELRRHGEAAPLVDELLAATEGVNAAKRGKYATIFAEVARARGEPARAQAWLDEAATLRDPDSAAPLEWTGVQADLWLDRGDAAAARALAEQRLAAHAPASVDDLPLALLRLRDSAARACEALGDWRAALAHQRALMDLREQLLGRSAQARRVALEVEHELRQARAQRDAATAERERLAALNEALAAANRAKSDFLAAASHDLRQPVHALALQVAALRGVLDAPRQHEMAARVERCVGALAGLFDGLLDLSRLDAGVVPVQRAPVALPALLAGLVEQHQPEAHARGLALGLRLPRVDPAPTTHSDALLLERLLRNLLVNALQHTERGGILVALRRRAGGWCIEVRDSGCGIPQALQSRVFDEFFQVGMAGTTDSAGPAGDAALHEARRRQGLGLGLAIVARLARLLGHAVTLRSAPGRGTCVAVQVEGAAAAAPIDPPTAGEAALPPGLRVAVVDDDPPTRAALADLLAHWGCEVRAVAAATELDGWTPDAALVDLRLARAEDGLAAVAALRARHGADLPCLVVTGETGPARLQRLQASGLPWAGKPLGAAPLRRWLREAGRPRSGRPGRQG